MWSSDLPNNKVLSSVVLKSLKGSNWLIFTVEVATAAFSSFQTPLAAIQLRRRRRDFSSASKFPTLCIWRPLFLQFLHCYVLFFIPSRASDKGVKKKGLPLQHQQFWGAPFWRSETLWKSSWFRALRHHHKTRRMSLHFFTAEIWPTWESRSLPKNSKPGKKYSWVHNVWIWPKNTEICQESECAPEARFPSRFLRAF